MTSEESADHKTREKRLAARKARRDQQRRQSMSRVEKMHDARLLWESSRKDVHSRAESTSALQLHVGCSGWFYWHWRGIFYPPGLPTRDWFAHYASRFDTVELNAPFYSWPTVATVQSWVRQAGRRQLIYTVKASELITHVKRFIGTQIMVRDFGHIADLLGSKMGCLLFQLPPSFHYTPARLRRILEQLDPARRNVVEFRHRSWWKERVFSAFQASGAIFCSCSAPSLPNDLVATEGNVYMRFHGLPRWYRHDYSTDELAPWVEKVRACGATNVWAYFNNDRDGHAIRNARKFRRMLQKSLEA